MRLTGTLQIRTREAKAALGLALHIRRVTWHTMILPCAGGEQLKRREWVGGGSTRREVRILQMGKMAFSMPSSQCNQFCLLLRFVLLHGTSLWLDFSLSSLLWHKNNEGSLCGTSVHRPEAPLMEADWFQQKIVSSRSRQQSLTEASWLAHTCACVFLPVFTLWPLLSAQRIPQLFPVLLSSPNCVNHRLCQTPQNTS